MRKIFGRNQFVLTALALLIAIVGYLNFTKDGDTQQPVSNSIDDTYSVSQDDILNENSKSKSSDEAGLVEVSSSNVEIIEDENKEENEDKKEDEKNNEQSTQKEEKDNTKQVSQTKEKVGEVVMVDNIISTDAIYNAKLNREQKRAKNKADLLKIVEDSLATQDMKDKALNEILVITSNSEKELAVESLLEAKGYENAIVSIVDDGADVVVDVDSISTEDAAAIMDVVKRKTGVSANNIVISPVTSSTQEPK